jgi:MoxR-like ATPase
MNEESVFRLYAGDGSTTSSRGAKLPKFEQNALLDDPHGYTAAEPLRDAVNVALALGLPLLVTGEPGTGKTQLAASVAYELGLHAPLVFHTKTTSVAKDLFYRYDALRHFHDAQFRKEGSTPDQYISYEAFGLAVLLSMQPENANQHLPPEWRDKGPTRSVVLIDEIDKAPRDLPNDILNEMENMSFTVHEAGRKFAADQPFRPILILSSNSEKSLPDAFLRRCVFYHISFPSRERLRAIVQKRLRFDDGFSERMIDQALNHFDRIRSLPLKKKPATAELLAWLQIIGRMQIDVNNLKPQETDILAITYSILAKNKEDLALLKSKMLGDQ